MKHAVIAIIWKFCSQKPFGARWYVHFSISIDILFLEKELSWKFFSTQPGGLMETYFLEIV